MVLKIKKRGVVELLFIVIIILDSNLFYLNPFQGFILKLNSAYNKYLIVFLSFLLMVIAPGMFKIFSKNKKDLLLYICYMLIAVFIVALFSFAKYKESLFDIITCMYHYMILFFSIPIYYCVYRRKEKDFIINSIINISVILCLILIVQVLFSNYMGKIILPGVNQDVISIRNGRMRFSTNSVNTLAIPFLASSIFCDDNKQGKIKSIIKLSIILFATFYVFMSRSLLVVYAGIIIVCYLSGAKTKHFRRWIVVLLGLLFITQLDAFTNFLESFSINSVQGTGLSTSVRLDAISYYWSVLKSNPLFGTGFIGDSVSGLQSILHGPYGFYYYSDLGAFGLLAETGIIGGSAFLFLTVYLVKLVIRLTKHKDAMLRYDYSCTVGLVTAWIFTSINMAVTNPRNSILMPIILGLVSGIYDIYKKNVLGVGR